jgi:hypothetical protein
MEVFVPLIAFVLGVGTGYAGYRYHLKRDPVKLERWAAAIKAARVNAERKLRERV